MLSQHPFTVVFMEGKYTTYTTYKYAVLFKQIYNLFQFQYHPHTHDTNNKKLWLTRKVNWKTIIMTSMGMSEMIQNCNIVVERLTNVHQCQNLSFHFPYCHLNHFVSWKSNKVYLSVPCVKKLVLWWHADNLCRNYSIYSSTWWDRLLYNLHFQGKYVYRTYLCFWFCLLGLIFLLISEMKNKIQTH